MKLQRLSDNGIQTLGMLTLPDGTILHTLELPYKNNEKKISCIPVGKYKCVLRKSDKYGWHYHIRDVPNRSYVLFHAGNYHTDILGCILVGKGLKDINNDGQLDVISSKKAMIELLNKGSNSFDLEITAINVV